MGSKGDCYHNEMIEPFWARMQVELLDRKRWNTRVELATEIFSYLEIFHNRPRRHSVLGMLTPWSSKPDINNRHEPSQPARPNPGHSRASTEPGGFHRHDTNQRRRALVANKAPTRGALSMNEMCA